MPVNYVFVNKMGAVCSSMNGKSSTFCLPQVIQCRETDTDGFLFLCDQKPCDVNCPWEDVTTIPFVRGDKIHFQLQFRDLVNADPTNPTLGWGDWVLIELYNGETGIIFGTLSHNMVDRYFVCHNGENSYQQIEIDTGEIGVPCAWYAKFYAYNGVDDESIVIDERCTHVYREADECEETHTVEGLYNKFDCVGNWYGQPECEDGAQAGAVVFKYSNLTRIEAKIKKLIPEIEVENDRNILVENYEFSTKHNATEPGRVFLHNYLISWYTNVLSARTIKIDGNILKNITNFALNVDSENPNSAVVEWSWKVKCNSCNAG